MMKPALPKSETHLGTNLLGYGVAVAAIFALKDSGLTGMDMAMAVIFLAVIPVLFMEYVVFKRHKEAPAQLGAHRNADLKRVAVKCLGLLGVLAAFLALYYVLPEYDKGFYKYVWPFYAAIAPAVLLSAPFYFAWCDRRLDTPEDGYYHLGNAMLLRWKTVDGKEIIRLLRSWLVKAFFLPLMFTYCVEAIEKIQSGDITQAANFIAIFFALDAIILFGDLLYATLGYIFTLRIFNAHIRSSEPTFLGWFAAVMCYYPFWHLLLYSSYFAYDDGANWNQILPEGIVQYVWGSVILCCYVVYALATVCLGIRFSNLTYRGLVTNGPYRFTKHPAYVAKNLGWWLVSLPFITHGGTELAISHTVALLGMNIVYYIRARTEENHLSNYPEYVEYAQAMNERSVFAPLARRITFLQYRKPDNLPKI